MPNFKDFFDLVFIGVTLCVSIALPFLWLNYSFKKKINREKQVRNPKNNEILFKKQTYKLHFKTGKTLHKKLNNISLDND